MLSRRLWHQGDSTPPEDRLDVLLRFLTGWALTFLGRLYTEALSSRME
jgi:hypothetical protein